MAMNTQKVVVGGVAAGVVVFVLDFLSNYFLMGDRWKAAMDALNPALSANTESTASMIGYVVLDLLFGILLVWMYAAIRSRFGPGPKTATYAALYLWIVTSVMWAGLVLMGMFGWDLFALGEFIWLVILLVSAYVGGMIYKEE